MQIVDEWLQNRLDKLHQIRIAKVLPQALASEIFQKMPEGQIFESSQLIDFIITQLGIKEDQQLIS